MTYGEKLRKEREARGMTREKLATDSGVPFGTVHGYEIGRRAPSFANVLALAKALGVTCEAFSGCDDVSPDRQEDAPPAKAKPAPKKPRKK